MECTTGKLGRQTQTALLQSHRLRQRRLKAKSASNNRSGVGAFLTEKALSATRINHVYASAHALFQFAFWLILRGENA